jgi:hypothetical protein
VSLLGGQWVRPPPLGVGERTQQVSGRKPSATSRDRVDRWTVARRLTVAGRSIFYRQCHEPDWLSSWRNVPRPAGASGLALAGYCLLGQAVGAGWGAAQATSSTASHGATATAVGVTPAKAKASRWRWDWST